jgi:defect-in-organelle-trafficking protein DotB
MTFDYIKPFDLAPNFSESECQSFLSYCSERGASDIVLQTNDYAWVEIKGRQRKASTRPLRDQEIKALLSGGFGAELIGVVRGGRDADRPYRFTIDRENFRYRVNIASGQIGDADDGISVTMRSIPETPVALESLGLPAGIEENLFQPRGLVLICGPTGSGKTTLMSAFYADCSEQMGDAKILLYEDPIEFLYTKVKNNGPRIRQMQIGRHIPDFAAGIRNAMRCKPTIIGIGEARDAETIGTLVEAALTGHGAYATMHTDSVAETISRAIQVFPPAQHSAVASKLLGSIRLVVVQILVPTLDGDRVAVREWLYFDDALRAQMGETDYTAWGSFLRRQVTERQQAMGNGLKVLLEAGRIDAKSYKRYAGEASA